MDLSAIPSRKANYRLELLDDESVLYHPSNFHMLFLNQTAALIWQLCDGERSVMRMITLLSEAYPESADVIAADVAATLQQLDENGALEWGVSGAQPGPPADGPA